MTQNPIFIPAQVGRASEDIALQIEAAIINKMINPGERLPSERKMQEQFQTGRGVIREAIRALKQKGLIEIKKGAKGGAYVKQIDVSSVSESLALFLTQNQIDPIHLSEFRESVDRTITLLAIARANITEKSQLLKDATQLKKMALEPEPDMEEIAELDRSMNIQLAKMAHNPVFEWIMNAIQLGFSSNDFILYKEAYFRKKTVDNWHETAALIKANDPLKALASISRHYSLLRRCLKQDQGESRTLDEDFWEDTQSNLE